MKVIILFFAICGAVFWGAKYYTTTWRPEHHRKKLCEAAKKYYEVNRRTPLKIADLKDFIDIDDLQPPYEGSWIVDQEGNDKDNLVKIYKWRWYKCPKEGFEIKIETADYPTAITCPKCDSRYNVEESETYLKAEDSLVQGVKEDKKK